MTIRTATMTDLRAVTDLEAACFPAAEVATEADFAARLSARLPFGLMVCMYACSAAALLRPVSLAISPFCAFRSATAESTPA